MPTASSASLLLAALTLSVATAHAQQLRPLLGKVVDADGQPIEGAEVHCVLPDITDGRHRAAAHEVVKTDARGRFRASIRPCTLHLVWAIGPDGDQRVCSSTTWTTSGRLVELRADQPRPVCKATIKGLEAWQDLRPFRLRLVPHSVELTGSEVEIGEDATCELPPMPAGRVHLEVVDKDGQPLGGRAYSTLQATATVTVRAPHQVPLRAVDGAGKPVAGARIRQRIDGGYSGYTNHGVSLPARHVWRDLGATDADGRLAARVPTARDPFQGTGWNRLLFVAEKEGHKSTHSGFTDKPFLDGKEVEREGLKELTFTMPAAEPMVGRLMLDEQRGLAGQRVGVRLGIRIQDIKHNGWQNENLLYTVRTDADGRFRVPQLQGAVDEVDVVLVGDPLTATLVEPELQRRTPFRAAALHSIRKFDGQKLEFAVGALRTVQLQLLDDTGGPANDVELLFVSREADSNYSCDAWTTSTTTDSAGRVALLLQPGKWFVFGRNERNMVHLDLDLDGDESRELRMQPMPAMRGKVVDQNGKPVVGARLDCHSSTWAGGGARDKGLESVANSLNWSWIDSVRTDANGTFHCAFLDLPGISYEARFRAGKAQSADFRIQADETPVTITVPTKQ
ncbi:MAG: hypothetical protein ACE37K_23060 [Planctomycetota bacterium]